MPTFAPSAPISNAVPAGRAAAAPVAASNVAASKPAGAQPAGAPMVLTPKMIVSLLAVLLSAMMSGLLSRTGGLALGDIEAHFGLGTEGGNWVNLSYAAGELAVMPFATWFAITFTVRRYYLFMLWMTALIGVVTPFVQSLPILLTLHLVQGVAAGGLVPLLMMLALRFLPAPIRLHGLALYALTATFAPNVALWITGYWLDQADAIRWLWWQFFPVAILCTGMVMWGMPSEPINWARFGTMDWMGLIVGFPALMLLMVPVGMGNLLDWFNSPIIVFCTIAGAAGMIGFIWSEWDHPAPFIRFQLLQRRNLQVAFTAFVLMLTVFYAGASLPMSFLATTQGYRVLQSAPLGLIVGVPQLVLGSVVAYFLYKKWVDARWVFASGLTIVALSCFWAMRLDPSWTWREFIPMQIMQAVGQPTAVVSMLYMSTSSVQPMEGPFVAGFINMLRALGAPLGVAFVGHFELARTHFHQTMMADRWGQVSNALPDPQSSADAASALSLQAATLSYADVYGVLGVLALCLAAAGSLFHYVPAPVLPTQPLKKPEPSK